MPPCEIFIILKMGMVDVCLLIIRLRLLLVRGMRESSRPWLHLMDGAPFKLFVSSSSSTLCVMKVDDQSLGMHSCKWFVNYFLNQTFMKTMCSRFMYSSYPIVAALKVIWVCCSLSQSVI